MKVNQGMKGGDDAVLLDRPTIDVIDAEVQKPGKDGPLEMRLGTIGAGIITQPNGSPRVMIHVEHPCGDTLAVFLNGPDLTEFRSILADAHQQASNLQRETLKATKQ